MLYDAVIVGSGASGGWVAMELTARGFRVLLLEAGPPRPDGHDVAKFDQSVQAKSVGFNEETRRFYINDLAHPYITTEGKPFNWIRSRMLGGRTNVWSRVMMQMSPEDFQGASRDGFGIDWPLKYEDVAPYYRRVELILNVSDEKFEKSASGHFEYMPESTAEFCRLKQVTPAILPGSALTHLRRQQDVQYIRTPFGFLSRSSSSVGSTLFSAMKTGLLTVMTNATVVQLARSPSNPKKIESVYFKNTATLMPQEACGRIVVLAASTLETTRILLNSTDKIAPQGMGNEEGLLGRYLCDHFGGVTIEGVQDSCSHVETSEGLLIPRFRNLSEADNRFLRGYNLQGFLRIGPNGSRINLKTMGEVLPTWENHVSLDNKARDAWGVPQLQIDFSYGDNELNMAADASETLRRLVDGFGYDVTSESNELLPPGTRSHELGTARMGHSAKVSVLAPNHCVWGYDNLYLVDGSSFPSAASQNPTMTILAMAARASTIMAAQLRL